MQREFEVFSRPPASSVAVKRGFSWPGFFLTWIWAFSRGLWLQGVLLFATQAAGAALIALTFGNSSLVWGMFGLIVALFAGLNGNNWRVGKLERAGYRFLGVVPARSPSNAVAIAARGVAAGNRPKAAGASYFSAPLVLQRLFAIVWLTWKAAFRFRLFLVIALLLLIAVVGLPLLIKDDGTARGFTQILLTYTLSVITGLLGLSTVWLACGTLSRDIEECQIQVLATKPLGRWQIWLGKWLGIVTLNAGLLAIAGTSVYGLLLWRATKLSDAEQMVLRSEVLVARGSARERDYSKEIAEETDRLLGERLRQEPNLSADVEEVRRQMNEYVKAGFQLVHPAHARTWEIDLGRMKDRLKERPLQIRFKFHSSDFRMDQTFAGMWRIGVPQKTSLLQREMISLAAETFHEFTIPENMFDENGLLTIQFINPNRVPLLFPIEDGLEVLYPEGGFALNFTRGVAVIFCWMAVLAALGLASASFLSFPVAAFSSLAILGITLSSGTIANTVSEGTLFTYHGETGEKGFAPVDRVAIPVFKAALGVINLARDFSPIESLSTGRSITWTQLGQAAAQNILFLGGILAVGGIFVLNRRELATAQPNQ
jgi:hypothetical protein